MRTRCRPCLSTQAFVEGSHELIDPLRLVRAAAASQEASDKAAARKRPPPPPQRVYAHVYDALGDADEPELKRALDGPAGGADAARALPRARCALRAQGRPAGRARLTCVC